MQPQSAKAKGKLLENYIAEQIRNRGLDFHATREIGSGSGKAKGDIHTNLLILGRQAVIEAKNQKTLCIPEWWKQTEAQTLGYGEPVLAFKMDREPLEATKVVIYLETLLDLLKKAFNEPTMQSPNKEMKWKAERLKNALNDFIKEFN